MICIGLRIWIGTVFVSDAGISNYNPVMIKTPSYYVWLRNPSRYHNNSTRMKVKLGSIAFQSSYIENSVKMVLSRQPHKDTLVKMIAIAQILRYLPNSCCTANRGSNLTHLEKPASYPSSPPMIYSMYAEELARLLVSASLPLFSLLFRIPLLANIGPVHRSSVILYLQPYIYILYHTYAPRNRYLSVQYTPLNFNLKSDLIISLSLHRASQTV